jgi:hypothetical protein
MADIRAELDGPVLGAHDRLAACAQRAGRRRHGRARVSRRGTVTVIGADPTDQNTIAAPDRVTPVTRTVNSLGGAFGFQFPASSVTLINLDG